MKTVRGKGLSVSIMSSENALAVMVKVPEPGRVKTRLVPPLTHEEAAGLYRAFVVDIFARMGALGDADLFAFYTPPFRQNEISDMVPKGCELMPQRGRNLGEKLHNVFGSLFNKGYKRVCVVGSDSPDIPLDSVEDAFRTLEEIRGALVIGPTRDGGYYLVAMNTLSDVPFVDIPWSTSKVFEATMKRAGAARMTVRVLREWYDIDTIDDLESLRDSKDIPATMDFIERGRLFERGA